MSVAEVDIWPRRRPRRERSAKPDNAPASAADSRYDFEFRPSRRGMESSGLDVVRSSSYKGGHWGSSRHDSFSDSRTLPLQSTIRRSSRHRSDIVIGDNVLTNPVATTLVRSAVSLIAAVCPSTVCRTFTTAYGVVTATSLLASALYSSARNDLGGGFTIGIYMIAVGIMIIMPLQNRHYQTCVCTTEARRRLSAREEVLTRDRYSASMSKLDDKIEMLSDQLRALRRLTIASSSMDRDCRSNSSGSRRKQAQRIERDADVPVIRPLSSQWRVNSTLMSESEDEAVDAALVPVMQETTDGEIMGPVAAIAETETPVANENLNLECRKTDSWDNALVIKGKEA